MTQLYIYILRSGQGGLCCHRKSRVRRIKGVERRRLNEHRDGKRDGSDLEEKAGNASSK